MVPLQRELITSIIKSMNVLQLSFFSAVLLGPRRQDKMTQPSQDIDLIGVRREAAAVPHSRWGCHGHFSITEMGYME